MRRQKHDCCIKTEKQFYVGSRVFFNGLYSLRYRAQRKDRSGKAREDLKRSTGRHKKLCFLCRNAQKEKIEPDLFNEGFEAVAEGAHSAVIGIERDNLLEIILRFAVVGFFIVDFVEAE